MNSQLVSSSSQTSAYDDFLALLKEEISPPSDGTETAEELVYRLKMHVNIALSIEQCTLILRSLFPERPIDHRAISRTEFVQLFDHLDNRSALRVLFERYAVPILNVIGAEQLKKFFLKEQEKKRSTRFCRHLIESVNEQLYSGPEACAGLSSCTLTLHGFYRLLSLDCFRLFNAVHDSVCQPMTYPLTHYFIATSAHLQYPSEEREVYRLLSRYPNITKMWPNKGREPTVLLATYRHLLFTGTRCLQVQLRWSNLQSKFSIPVLNRKNANSTVHLSLEDFLTEVYWSAFKKSPYPVVLQFTDITTTTAESDDLRTATEEERAGELYKVVAEKLQSTLYKPLAKQAKFPSVKNLHNKFLVYYFSGGSGGNANQTKEPFAPLLPTLLVGSLLKSGENGGRMSKKETAEQSINSLVTLYEDRDKVTFWESFSADRHQLLTQIEQSAAEGEAVRNEWPSVTERNLMAVHSGGGRGNAEEEAEKEEKEFSTSNSAHHQTIALLQAGVQCVPVTPENAIARSFFRLNGGCGYVAKPIYLRKGQMYKRLSEDRLLKDELPSCVFRFSVRIIGTSPLRGLTSCDRRNQLINATVKMRLFGQQTDAEELELGQFSTSACRTAGLTPYWNEQTRFRVRVPDLAFFYFELYNCGRLVGYHALPVKAVLKGNRHVPLYDGRTHELMAGGSARLFLHIDYKMITHGWRPEEKEEETEEEEAEKKKAAEEQEVVSVPL